MSRRLIGLLLLLWGVATAAQPASVEGPWEAVAARTDVPIPELSERRWPNGLRTLHAWTHHSGLVSVRIAIANRFGVSEPGQHLQAALVQLWTRSRVSRRLAQLGGDLDVSVSPVAFTLSVTVASRFAPETLRLLAQQLNTSSWSEGELAAALTSAAQERVQQALDIQERARARALAEWGAGSEAPFAVDRVSLGQASRLQSCRVGMVVAVAGDLTRSETHRALHRLSQRHSDAPCNLEFHVTPSGGPGTAAQRHIQVAGVPQTAVVLQLPAPRGTAPDWLVAKVATTILGAGFNSRLNARVRVASGLTYGVGAWLESSEDWGWVQIRMRSHGESVSQAVELTKSTVRSMSELRPQRAELDAAVELLCSSFDRQLQATSGVARLLADFALRGGAVEDVSRYRQRLREVTAEQVTNLARRYWAGDILLVSAGASRP